MFLSNLFKLLRVKDWIKNFFVLAPLVFSGGIYDEKLTFIALFSMLLFCIGSSSAYILNDLHDRKIDRGHPVKNQRPLASGALSVKFALISVFCIYILLIISWFFMKDVVYVIFVYCFLNIAYTYSLKKFPVVDIFIIATGFVLRVIAGSFALTLPLSELMLLATFCLALYLASIKRRQELIQNEYIKRDVLKKYSINLLNKYAEMSATGALLFYSLFVVTSKIELAITVPFVLFGLYRYWYLVEELKIGESPTDVLLYDKQLIGTIFLWAGFLVFILKV